MRVSFRMLTALGLGSALMGLAALPASAACTRLAFSVNDYGKEGPTKDAKVLLDKYIAKTMAEKGVSKYTTGKKDVSCELFLNFIVFDEHTCKAEATVCWDGSVLPKSEQVSAEGNKDKASGSTTGSIDKPAEKKSAEKHSKTKPANEGDVAAAKEIKPATEAVPAVKDAEKPAEAAASKVEDAIVPPAPAAAQ